MALALNCKTPDVVMFDRKNYYYPDLPKGYQITQAETPIGINGYVDIDVNGETKRIRIHDIHIEEDTCKSIHYKHHSFLDFNRAGVPLVEIVTEADMHSAEEAMAYVEKLRELFLYADISDCKIEEGSMRCDVNISISKTDELGVRAEIKNIGSISSVGKAINREAARQEELLENGKEVTFATYRYDEKKDETIMMRVKEAGNDYRYFPEPDIPFVELDDEIIKEVTESIPMLASERRKIYVQRGISELNANKIIQNRDVSDYLNNFLDTDINLVQASNLLLGDISAYLNKEGKSIFDTKLDTNKFIDVALPNNVRLDTIGGDFDGDTISVKIPYSIEANDELAKTINKKSHYIGLGAKNKMTTIHEGLQSLYNLTMCLPEDEDKMTKSSDIKF